MQRNDPWFVGTPKRVVAGKNSDGSSGAALSYRELFEFLKENPQYLDHPIRFHDDENGVWCYATQLRHDSEDEETLVLEGNEDILPKK